MSIDFNKNLQPGMLCVVGACATTLKDAREASDDNPILFAIKNGSIVLVIGIGKKFFLEQSKKYSPKILVLSSRGFGWIWEDHIDEVL